MVKHAWYSGGGGVEKNGHGSTVYVPETVMYLYCTWGVQRNLIIKATRGTEQSGLTIEVIL